MGATFFFIFLAASMLAGAFIWLSGRKHSLARELEDRLLDLKEQHLDFEQRLTLLEAHAVDYILSVGSEGTWELLEMKNLLAQVDVLATEVQGLIVLNDFSALHSADRLLDYDFREFETKNPNFDRQSLPAGNWEDKFEELLQSLGDRVSKASALSTGMHLQKRRNRRLSTITGLAEIGIRAVLKQVRAKDAPVRTLLTKRNSPPE